MSEIKRMCFRCYGHFDLIRFSSQQKKSHSSWCRNCETYPCGFIPKLGIPYSEANKDKL